MDVSRAVIRAIILLALASCPAIAPCATGLSATSRTVTACGSKYTVKVVQASPADYRLRVGMAQGRVGLTSSLDGIVKRYGASAAINGCFFDAYGNKAVRAPYHTVITGGQMVHRGDVGALLGVWADGTCRISAMKTRISGALDGSEKWPNNWYAYWLNRLPTSASTVTIFTPAFARSTTPSGGTQAVVKAGTVASCSPGSKTIPSEGYVVYFSGAEVKLAQRFRVGRSCSWRVSYAPTDGSTGWDSACEGMGSFPQLVGNGAVTVSSSTVTRGGSGEGGNRSAVGVKQDGTIVFVTAGSLSLFRLANVMKALGCTQALNLDGGASSGLYANGTYLTRPGRQLPNALLLVKR